MVFRKMISRWRSLSRQRVRDDMRTLITLATGVGGDVDGRFEYRLPPGDWRFLGPLFAANEAQPVTVVFSPETKSATPTFQVHAGAAERKVTMRIALGRLGPNDL